MTPKARAPSGMLHSGLLTPGERGIFGKDVTRIQYGKESQKGAQSAPGAQG